MALTQKEWDEEICPYLKTHPYLKVDQNEDGIMIVLTDGTKTTGGMHPAVLLDLIREGEQP
jgi:hypothetical protein